VSKQNCKKHKGQSTTSNAADSKNAAFCTSTRVILDNTSSENDFAFQNHMTFCCNLEKTLAVHNRILITDFDRGIK